MSTTSEAPWVLLHPLGVDGAYWDPLVAHLPADVKVHRPDLAGHGGATPVAATVEAMTDDVVGRVRRSAGSRPVTLVGVSLGALVAQRWAASHPDDVTALVLADTVVTYPPAMRRMWTERASAVRQGGLAAVWPGMRDLWFSPGFVQHSPGVVADVRRRLLSTDSEGYARSCEALASVDLSEPARTIRARTLVITGADDTEPFQAGAAWLADHLADAQSASLPGRHAATLESAALAADLVVDFVAG